MTNKDTGGPAFPGLHPSEECRFNDPGMTLRDYFATAALQGLCAGFCSHDEDWPRDDEPEGYEIAAKHAYQMADAMLKARESREQ